MKIPQIFKTRVFALVKKEVLTFFSSPTGYIILGLFIAATYILFFGVFRFLQYQRADLSTLFTSIALSFIIIIPALTMSSISKEKQNGTIEFILTQPLSIIEFIAGKFLAYSIVTALMLVLTLPLTIFVGLNARLDFGQTLMQYLGAYILGLCFSTVGICISALFKSEIASLLVSILVSALLVVSGSELVRVVPFGLDSFFDKLSLLTHYQSLTRGVLDIRDVIYFLVFLGGFLTLTYFLLIREKLPKKSDLLKNARLGTIGILITLVIVAFFGNIIPGRIDFTSKGLYTLSGATNNVLGKVSDVLNINFFASRNIPVQLQSQVKAVSDLLRDYSINSGGKIKVETREPDVDESAKTLADQLGITPFGANVIDSSSSQSIVSYFGLSFSYLDKSEVLNLNPQSIDDAEYEITKKINKLANTELKEVGILTSAVGLTIDENLQNLNKELSEIFKVSRISITEDKITLAESLSALIIPFPKENVSQAVFDEILKFYNSGKSVLLMAETIDLSSQTSSAVSSNLMSLFSGVGFESKIIFDTVSNVQVPQNEGFFTVLKDYPYWVIYGAQNNSSSILKGLTTVATLWSSPITIDSSSLGENKAEILLNTQEGSGSIELSAFTPNALDNLPNSYAEQTLAYSLENPNGGRAVIMGDADFIEDNLLQTIYQVSGNDTQAMQNLSFVINAVSWLSKQDSLGEIKAKSRSADQLNLNSSSSTLFPVIAAGTPLLLLAGTALFRYFKRKQLVKSEYKS